MNKAMVFVLVVFVLTISGCTLNVNEKLASLQKRVEALEAEIGTCSDRVSMCENEIGTVKQRLDAADELLKHKEAGAAASGVSLSGQEIQTALKNAGYYTGAIDGKIGPNTQKAMKEFQQGHALTPDGKIGARTQALLSKYLKQQSAAE